MSIVKDMSLAESGRRKIQWVRDFMPALSQIEARSCRKALPGPAGGGVRPFGSQDGQPGLRPEAGRGGGVPHRSNPLSTQDDVAAGLASLGVETFGIHGAMGEEYENLLIETLKFKPHLVVDDGGDLIHLLGGKCADLGEHLIGGCEETTTGILRLKARGAGRAFCPAP